MFSSVPLFLKTFFCIILLATITFRLASTVSVCHHFADDLLTERALFQSNTTGVAPTGNQNSICDLKKDPNFTLDLISAIIFSDYLLLIDRKETVYKVPRHDLIDSYGHLKFDDVPGVPIETFWPGLVRNKQWKKIKTHQKSIFHIIDKTGHVLIYMDIFQQNASGLIYDPVTNRVSDNPGTYSLTTIQQYIMDSGQAQVIYSLGYHTDPVTLFFNSWNFAYFDNGTRSGAHGTYNARLLYLINEANPQEKNLTIIKDAFTNKALIDLQDKRFPGWRLEEVISDWNISNTHLPVGYFFKDDIYLFNFHRVMKFYAGQIPPMSDINSAPDKTVLMNSKVTTITYNDFFICKNNVDQHLTWPPRKESRSATEGGHPSWFWWVIGAVILLLLLGLLLCLFFLGRKHRKKKTKRSKSKGPQRKRSSHLSKKSHKSSKVSKLKMPSRGRNVSAQTQRSSAARSFKKGSFLTKVHPGKDGPSRGPSKLSTKRSSRLSSK